MRRLLLAILALALPLRAAPLEPAPEGSFSIVVLPDTQHYLGEGTKIQPDSTDPVTNPIFMNHVAWVRDHLADQRIVFVSHVGDIVDKNNPAQWAVARQAMDLLHGLVPYGISVGNHDLKSSGDASLFQQHFGAARFAEFAWYGGSYQPAADADRFYGDNANSFQLFEAAGEQFVFLHLECNAPDPVVAWANEVLTRYANRHAFLTTHMDLGPAEKPATNAEFATNAKGRMRWTKVNGAVGNSGEQLWDKLYRRHANLELIFCGDQSRTTAYRLASRADDGHTIWSLLSDYVSSGPLRIYRFLPSERRVQAIAYDTTKLDLVTTMPYAPDPEQHQFSLPWPPVKE